MFCRVLTHSPNRVGAQTLANMAFMDSQVIERVKELEQRSLLANTETRLSASKGEEIERLALMDTLTELYNSRTFLKECKDELRRAKRYKRPVALCMLCIDGFRDVTRQYGALTSDAVLKAMGDVLRGAIRDVDIPARYSAEEFAIIFPETNAAGASIVAERIRQRISSQFITHNWHNLKVTASIGLASFPAHARESEELVARSIQALEVAINRGGDRVCTI
jgi:two-component system cell cycle response regulator